MNRILKVYLKNGCIEAYAFFETIQSMRDKLLIYYMPDNDVRKFTKKTCDWNDIQRLEVINSDKEKNR